MSGPLFISHQTLLHRTSKPLRVGCRMFDGLDQLDFTGPFESLSRMPDSSLAIVGKIAVPVSDMNGLRFFPDRTIAEVGLPDVLVVRGGNKHSCATRKCLVSFTNTHKPIRSYSPYVLGFCYVLQLAYSPASMSRHTGLRETSCNSTEPNTSTQGPQSMAMLSAPSG